MSDYVIPQPAQPSLPVKGTNARFPVRRIYCIGRNYADHAVEMGHDPDKEPPFFFQKNGDNVISDGEFPYPPQTNDVHYEVEMVVALKSGGANISEADAMQHVFGYGIGLGLGHGLFLCFLLLGGCNLLRFLANSFVTTFVNVFSAFPLDVLPTNLFEPFQRRHHVSIRGPLVCGEVVVKVRVPFNLLSEHLEL